jgi:hypothetical protein
MKTGIAYIHYRATSVQSASSVICHPDPWPMRYSTAGRSLEKMLDDLPEAPAVIVIEEPNEDQEWDPREAHLMSRLNGVFAVCVSECGRKFPSALIVSVRPIVWKLSRPKKETSKELAAKYGFARFDIDDEADALGVADYGFQIARRSRWNLHGSRAGQTAAGQAEWNHGVVGNGIQIVLKGKGTQ